MPTGLERPPVEVQKCPAIRSWRRGEEEKEKEKAAEEGTESYVKN